MSDKTVKTAIGKAMTVDRDKRTLTATITTRSVDRDGDIIEPEGIDTTNFDKNPVVLWAHNYSQIPVAKITKLYTNPQGLLAEIVFAEHSFAKDVFNLYADGFLNAWSIGFVGQKGYVEPRLDEDGRVQGYVYNKVELLELSAVPIPANPEALTRSFEGVSKNTLSTMSKSLETMPENLKSDAEQFIVAANKAAEEDVQEEQTDEAVKEGTEEPVEEKQHFYAVYAKGAYTVFGDTELEESIEKTVRESAFNKSFNERGVKGDVPLRVEFGDTASTKVDFLVIQESDGEIVEAKVCEVCVVLPSTKTVETPEVAAEVPEETKDVSEEVTEAKTEGRDEEVKEEATSDESEAVEPQEEHEEKAVEEETVAGKSLEDMTVKLRQRQVMLRARMCELGQ